LQAGRFPAVLAAAAFVFSTRAQATPRQGAVVTHINRDLSGWFYTKSADGQLRLDYEFKALTVDLQPR
jgi:hypothetical protein